MEEILKTTLLEYDKSTFLIDLVRHNSGGLYVEIQQTINLIDNRPNVQKIKINPSVIDDIIEVLTQYKEALPKTIKPDNRYFSKERIEEIIKRYLKGSVEIKHLADQFNCSEQIIEQILNNNNIADVNEKPGKVKRFRYRKKKG